MPPGHDPAEPACFKFPAPSGEEGTSSLSSDSFCDSNKVLHVLSPPPSPRKHAHRRGGTVTALDAAKVAEAISPKAHQEQNVDSSVHHVPNYVDYVTELRNPLSPKTNKGPKVDPTDLPEQLNHRSDKRKSS